MSYITTAQLAEWPGAQEVADAATPAHQPVVHAALMEAVLQGASTAAWPTADVTVAQAALATVNAAITAAAAEIDGYLSLRYALPLSPVPAACTEWARKIVRYRIHKDLRIAAPGSDTGQHPIHADYLAVIDLLRDIAAGKLALGPSDPDPPSSAAFVVGEVRHFKRAADGLQ